jgi:hypothetical protein
MSLFHNEDINELVKNKEDEIKNIFNTRIRNLEIQLGEKEKQNLCLQNELEKLKADFEFNFNLLEDRDNDIKIFEEKIDSFIIGLKEKDSEIGNLKNLIDELNLKIQNEKNKKENEIELVKYKLNQQNLQNKDEIRNLTNIIKAKEKEIDDLKITFNKKFEDLNKQHQEDLKNLKGEICEKTNFLKERENVEKVFYEKEIFLNKKIEDLTNNFSKINNENLILIKEKMQIETKLKMLENSENENKSNNYFTNEKNKFLSKENEELKLEINNKNYKIENLNKINEELNIELHGLKQKLSFKEFEIEKKNLSEKINAEKLKDLTSSFEKLTQDKKLYAKELEDERIKNSSLEHKLRLINDEKEYIQQKQTEEVKRLNEELRRLNEANTSLRKEIDDIELKYKNKEKDISKEQTYSQPEDFFKNNASNYINNNVVKPNNFEIVIMEKDEEIERLIKEITGLNDLVGKAQGEINRQGNVYKEVIRKLQDDNEKLKVELIRAEVEAKNSKVINTVDNDEVSRLTSELNQKTVEIQRLKNEINDKAYENNKLKETINAKINETNKLKKERDRLAVISNNLRAEVNRLENSLQQREMLSDCEYYYDNFEQPNEDNYEFNSLNFEEIRRKKDIILNKDNSIKAEAKKHIDNILNGDERSKSNGIRANLRKVQVDNLHYKSRSPSNSKSPVREENYDLKDYVTITKLSMDNNFINKSKDNIQITEDMPCMAIGGVKLLKRNKSKPKVTS